MKAAQKTFTPKTIFQLVLVVGFVPILPQLISARWNWWEAWFFTLTFILIFVLSRVLASRRHPDILKERVKSLQMGNAKSWDKILAPLVALGFVLIPLVVGLDARYGTAAGFPIWAKILAIVFLLGGYSLSSYALVENRYFSGVVRIQDDRGHKVVSSGPYQWMRHPGYTGMLFSFLATPILLDSYWALVPAVLLCIALVIRTVLEDRTLQEELRGYQDYAKQVRYRLLPGFW